MPHPATVGKWYRKIKCKSGINEASLKAIKRKVDDYKSNNENRPLLANLVFDEMKINRKLISLMKENMDTLMLAQELKKTKFQRLRMF